MQRCAFLTMDDLTGFHTYDDLVHPCLRRLGWAVENVSWRAPVSWDDYDLVVIRSTWDYQEDPDAFLRVLSEIERSPARLENPLDVVRWNLDKRYLLELAAAGVPVVPSVLLEAGDPIVPEALRSSLGSPQIVLKPTVSANADRTFRLRRGEDEACAIEALRGGETLAQPYVPSIESAGEVSLFYFAGRYSHAIRKRPRAGDFRVQEEHGGRLSRIEASADEHRAAEMALAAAPGPLLYARVDLVDLDGAPVLMELELIEPSLYFNLDPASPARFAAALHGWVSGSEPARATGAGQRGRR